ncbi:MAG: hypothetical protein SGJ01_17565 [Gemmatimonadota bacterium]|nr:hypothetical protein [Gemmatimonadota bacterium]
MTQVNDFGPDRDDELGNLLREHLSGADTAGFTARVLERIPAGSNSTAWEILAGWARPGLAAALLLATLTGFWLVARQNASSGVEVLAVDGLETGQTVAGDGLLAAVLASGR